MDLTGRKIDFGALFPRLLQRETAIVQQYVFAIASNRSYSPSLLQVFHSSPKKQASSREGRKSRGKERAAGEEEARKGWPIVNFADSFPFAMT